MKTLQKILIVSASILIMSIQLNAQNTEGKLNGIDFNPYEMKTEFEISKISKSEIPDSADASSDFKEYKISDSNGIRYKHKVKKDKLYLSVGTGINFVSFGFIESYDPGLNIQFDITKIISSGYAIRGDIQFSQNRRKSHDYIYSEYNYNTYEGGDLNNYSLKFDFLLGALKPSSVINGYGILGGGFNIVQETERKNTYSYQEFNSLTNEFITQTYSNTEKGQTIGEVVLEFGGGLGIKVSDRIRLFGEAQYGFPILFLAEYSEFNPLSFFYGNPTLKIGAQIGF